MSPPASDADNGGATAPEIAGRSSSVTPSSPRQPTPAGTSALPQRFGRNVFMNYAAQGLMALSALVLTPILLHHLGKSTYGLWVVASGAVTYLELFELGFGGATTKLIAEDAEVRPAAALRTLNSTFFVLLPLGVLALLGGVGLSFALPHLVHLGVSSHREVFAVVFLLAVALAVSIPGDTFGGALGGFQRYDLLGASNASMTVIIAVVSIAVVVSGGGIVMLALTTTIVSVLFHLVRYGMVSRILPGTRISPRLVDPAQRRNALHLSGWFLLQGVLGAIYATGDVMIVGIVLGLKDAAIYAVGSKLAGAAIAGLDSMAQVFFPYASASSRNDDPEALVEITVEGTRVTIVPGVMISLVFVVLATPGIKAWVGPGFATSATVLVVLALSSAAAAPVRALSNILAGAGSLPLVCAVRSVEVTVNIALSVTLGLAIGPVGVALGTLGGIVLVRLPGFLYVGCRSIGIGVPTFLRRTVVPSVVPAAACTGVLLAFRPVAHSIGMLVVAALVAMGVYLGLYFVTGATVGERRRAAAFVTRPLPPRWRHDPESAASMLAEHDRH